MRLYINTSEVPKLIEALENSPMRNTPEISSVLERILKCKELQKSNNTTHLKRAGR